MPVEQNVAVFRKFVDVGLNQKNLAAIQDEILAPDLVLEAPGVPTEVGRKQGKEQFILAVNGFTGAFPDVKVEMKYTIAEGETVAVDLPYEGTHTGDFAGVHPTGVYIHAAELWFVEYENGKMKNVRICEYGRPLRQMLMAAVHP